MHGFGVSMNRVFYKERTLGSSVLLIATALEEAGARRADNVEEWHPCEEDAGDDDGEDDAKGGFRHFISPIA